MTRVIYSTGARLAGGGIGNTSYHAVHGLFRHRMLERLICGSYRPTDIPRIKIRALGISSRIFRKIAIYDKSNKLDLAYRAIFDKWAVQQLSDCTAFHGWSGYCLKTLKAAKERGAITVLDRALAHPAYLDKMLYEEYSKWEMPYKHALTSERVRNEIKVADYIFVPSDFVRKTFQAEGESTEKLIQIPFGVDTKRFHPLSQTVEDKPFRALFVGQVSIRKGAHILLEAWRLLNWKNAELWFVGQKKVGPHILNQFIDLKGVRFFDHVSNPIELFQQADVFVFPSLLEGSALVTYEAIACGLPVITTQNSGSVIRDGREGFLVPIRDPGAVAARLDQLRRDEDLKLRMGISARLLAEAYTWERYGDRVAKKINEITQPNGLEDV